MWRGLSWFNSLYLYCLACILSYTTAEVIKTLVEFSTLSTELLSLRALSEFGMTHSSLFPNLHGNTVCAQLAHVTMRTANGNAERM